jgi:hypothetical protein
MNEGWQSQAFAYIKRAHAFGTMEFMSGQRQKIDIHGAYVDGHIAHGLYSIRMKEYTALAAQSAISQWA